MTTDDTPPLRDRLRTATRRSRLGRATSTSLTLAALGRLGDALGAVSAALGRGAAASRTAGSLRTADRWVRNSVLYRWLTNEPDPAVVVIDLRETYTVGPIIALLDRLADPVGRSYRQSGLCRLGAGLQSVAERVERTGVGRALGRLLAPPDPPETPERAGRGRDADRPPSGSDGARTDSDASRAADDDRSP